MFRKGGESTLKKLSLATLTSAVTYALASLPVYAQAINLTPNATGNLNKLAGYTIPGIISFAVTFILVVAALLFFFMLVWGGIEWITSGGDKAANENARKRITNALIGLAIVFSAWAIVSLINLVFGINIFSLSFTGITY
jgi:hypothetical protein